MTAKQFRKLALALPEAEESAHMGHPDFRIGGKIFATLGPDEDWGMVKLPAARQSTFLRLDQAFETFAGAWGKWGCTRIILKKADTEIVRQALMDAWRNTAPKKMLAKLDEE